MASSFDEMRRRQMMKRKTAGGDNKKEEAAEHGRPGQAKGKPPFKKKGKKLPPWMMHDRR